MAMGRFADLSSYRRSVDEPTASPLDSLLQGYQQGRDIRKMPQEDLMNQIQLQLAQAKLRDALNPEEASARKIKEQLQMNLAERSGQLGTGIFPSDIKEPVGTPKAISPLQEAAITQGGLDPESLNLPKAGAPITPVMYRGQPVGFAIDPDKAISEQVDLSRSKGANAADIAQLRNEMAMQQLSNKIDEGQKNRDSREKIAATRGGNTSYVNPNDYNDIIQVAPGEQAPDGYVQANTFFKGQQVKNVADNISGRSITNKDDINSDINHILEGTNTMYNIRQTMGRTNKAAEYMQAIRSGINKIDPKFDFVASDAGGKSVSTPYVQRSTSAINAVLPNIDKVVDLSKDVDRIGIKGIDNLLQKGEVQFGNKKVSNFRQARNLLADEIGVALGAGVVSDMKLQLGFDVTDPSVSDEVFASNMGVIKDFLQNRKKALQGLRYSSSTINNGGNPQETNTSTPSPTVGQQKTFPNGKIGVWDGNGWKAQ